MNQPLHNNAIPAHPGVAQQQKAAVAAEPVSAPAPTERSESSALWDAFDERPEEGSSPSPVASPTPSAEVQPPPAPPPVAELPPTVEELLGGGSSPVGEAPATTPEQPVPSQQPEVSPTQAGPPPIDMAAVQKQAIDYLMANEYKLTDEDRTRLISAPDEVLPQMAARMHVGIATQLAQHVAQAIPMMIQQQLDSHMKAQRAEMEFFASYPKLNRPEFKPIIAESLQMVRQMNPKARREEIIAKGAALAAFQIQSRYSGQARPTAPQPPARGPAAPYVPIASGGGAAPPTNPNQQPNIWADLASDPDFNPW